MEHLRTDSVVARHVAEHLDTEAFTVLDVGCGGGIDAGWRVFGSRLEAVGIDPSLNEIARLSAAEPNPKVRYFAGFAGLPDGHPLRELSAQTSYFRRSPWDNLSAPVSIANAEGRFPPVPSPVLDVLSWEEREAQILEGLEGRLAKFHFEFGENGLAAVTDPNVILDEGSRVQVDVSKSLD